MKKLQNNFTTPEQSKRLLELGVPADSADGYYSCYVKTCLHSLHTDKLWHRPRFMTEDNKITDWNLDKVKAFYLPLWSVGRLIEIITICRAEIYTRLLFSRVDDHTNIENLIHYISAEIENGHIDFSKLEE